MNFDDAIDLTGNLMLHMRTDDPVQKATFAQRLKGLAHNAEYLAATKGEPLVRIVCVLNDHYFYAESASILKSQHARNWFGHDEWQTVFDYCATNLKPENVIKHGKDSLETLRFFAEEADIIVQADPIAMLGKVKEFKCAVQDLQEKAVELGKIKPVTHQETMEEALLMSDYLNKVGENLKQTGFCIKAENSFWKMIRKTNLPKNQ